MEIKGILGYFEQAAIKWFREVVMKEWLEDVVVQPPVFPEIEPILFIKDEFGSRQVSSKSFVPVTFSASNLPLGIRFHTGESGHSILGRAEELYDPSADREHLRRKITITATNMFGASETEVFYSIESAPFLESNPSTIELNKDEAVSDHQLFQVKCVPAPTIEITSGSLPSALVHRVNSDNNGEHNVYVSGTPTIAGASNVTFQISNKYGVQDVIVTFNVAETP